VPRGEMKMGMRERERQPAVLSRTFKIKETEFPGAEAASPSSPAPVHDRRPRPLKRYLHIQLSVFGPPT
jgi:hypothetical protein